nr:lytic transglycosylase domain-containing protein [Methylobacterium sp. 17Sr1-1]
MAQGLDPSFLASVGAQESGNFDPRVVSGRKRSSAGAIGIMQFMPKTAAEYGIDPINPEQSIDAAALYLRRSLDRRKGNEALALADYNAGPGRVNSVGGDISRLPAETQNYIAKILTATPQATELAKAQKARTDRLESERQSLEIANRLLGRNGEAYDAATRAQQMLADAERQGIPVTDAYRAQIERVAGGMAAANRALADTRLGRDLEFEREQLGRSAGDQSAFARVRAAYGDTTSDPAQAAIGRIREIDMLKEGRATFQETFGGVVSSLSRGATAATAFSQVLNRFADKAINVGTDMLGGLLFGGGKSGGAGLLGSLLGGASSWMPKFADGGIMTSGGALPLHRYATGGIANSPQLALFGEGRGPEAFVPLPDGRRIPVAMTGAPSNQNPAMTDARSYSFDLSGSNLTEAQVRAALTQAIAANNQERDRTHFERVETLRRMGPY